MVLQKSSSFFLSITNALNYDKINFLHLIESENITCPDKLYFESIYSTYAPVWKTIHINVTI